MAPVSHLEIVETAALLALEGPRSRHTAAPVPAQRLYDALRLSRLQLRLWMTAANATAAADNDERLLQQRRALLEEIFVCEPAVRVACALLARNRDCRPEQPLVAIAGRFLADHGEAKRMALRELLADALSIGVLAQVNSLRSRMERWTDLLLGIAGAGVDAATFGFDERRVLDHRRDVSAGDSQLVRLVLSGLQRAVPDRRIDDNLRSRTLRSLHDCFIGLVPAGGPFPRTRLQQQIFGDHLLTDRPYRGLDR